AFALVHGEPGGALVQDVLRIDRFLRVDPEVRSCVGGADHRRRDDERRFLLLIMSSTRTIALFETTAELSLLDRLRRRDLSALGHAYDLHHEHVRAFARRLIGDDAAAE